MQVNVSQKIHENLFKKLENSKAKECYDGWVMEILELVQLKIWKLKQTSRLQT